jgi:hypothetical protein
VTQAQAIQTAYNSSREEGKVQAGSSMASRFRALGGHVTQCVHRALHLGVQKALGVEASHYRINLGAISTGYAIPEGLDDEGAEVEMNRVDALAAPAANVLAEDFMEILQPAPRALREIG